MLSSAGERETMSAARNVIPWDLRVESWVALLGEGLERVEGRRRTVMVVYGGRVLKVKSELAI